MTRAAGDGKARAGRARRLLKGLPPLIGLLLLAAALHVVRREVQGLGFADIAAALRAIPRRALWEAAGCTIAAYGVLTFYDKLASIYAGHGVGYLRTSFASFCAYALSHNLGFSAVSGAAVRYRLYAHWGLSPFQIAKVIAFCSLTFGLGGMVLGGLVLFAEPDAVPFLGAWLPRPAFWAAGLGLWGVVGGYLALSRLVGRVRLFGHVAELPDWRMAMLQVGLATLDVVVTAAIFYVLLPPAPGLDYGRFLAVYLASYSAGLLASLPGGLGVFDAAMLLGLAPALPAPPVLGAILVFRLFYYIVPLFLAGGLFAGNEALTGLGRLRARPGAVASAEGRAIELDFEVAALVGMAGLCGALLLGLGIVDPRPDFAWAFTDWIGPRLAEMAAEAGQYVPSLLGTALLLLALGLARRAAAAWGATLAVLSGSVLFTAAQGTKLWIPEILACAAIVLLPCRRAFHRRGRLLSGRLPASSLPPLLTLLGCLLALAAFEPHVRALDRNSWWAIVLSPGLPGGARAAVGLTVLLALAAAWRLLRPGVTPFLPWIPEGARRHAALAPDPPCPPARADGLVLGDQGLAGAPFLRVGPVLLGLGDPVGAAEDRVSAIWRLRDLARQEGLDPGFWGVGPGLLRVYGDLGLTALPLGADGMPMPQFDDEPAASYLCCAAERDLTGLLPLLREMVRDLNVPID